MHTSNYYILHLKLIQYYRSVTSQLNWNQKRKKRKSQVQLSDIVPINNSSHCQLSLRDTSGFFYKPQDNCPILQTKSKLSTEGTNRLKY